ncbi:hypothetical protein ACN28I_06335 [Archangium gephyra]|uniref:hypothetical protein n=1 Tax=Archangium gephyra TaxID=48 RepID=UPI003B815FF1
MAENSSESRWKDRLELAAQVALVIAVGGYLSHRAHLNRLGVPLGTPLSFERYLAEAAYVVSDSLEVLLRTALVPLVLLLLGSAAVAFLASRKRLPQPPVWLRRWKPQHLELVLPLALLLGLIVLLQNLFMPPELPFGVVVGPLSVKSLEAPGPAEARLLYGVAMLVWLLCMGAISVLAPPGKRGGLAGLAWFGCRGVLLLGAVTLFMHYGVTVHESTYPFVEVRHAKEPEDSSGIGLTSGALVVESAEALIVWNAQQGTGTLTSIPRDAVLSIRIKPGVDVLAVAREEAVRGAKVPTAPSVQPSAVISSPAGGP